MLFLARSPAFYQVLLADMDQTGFENIANVDISEQGVKALLKYIYYYCVKDGIESAAVAIELLHAGKRYDIPALQNAMACILAERAGDTVESNEQNTDEQDNPVVGLIDFVDYDEFKKSVSARQLPPNYYLCGSHSDSETESVSGGDDSSGSEVADEPKYWLGHDEAIQLYLWFTEKNVYKTLQQKLKRILIA